MTAKEKFRVGEKVQLTPHGWKHFKYSASILRHPIGVVHGFCRSNQGVRILQDGRKSPVGYHISFWEAKP